MEFNIDVECPHCDHELSTCVEFDENQFDECGGRSYPMREECPECYKEFWFIASISFSIDVDDTFKKKPKVKK